MLSKRIPTDRVRSIYSEIKAAHPALASPNSLRTNEEGDGGAFMASSKLARLNA